MEESLLQTEQSGGQYVPRSAAAATPHCSAASVATPCCSGVAVPYCTTVPVRQRGDFHRCSAELRTGWKEGSTGQSDDVLVKGKKKVQDSGLLPG